jgi:hypothetical protein
MAGRSISTHHTLSGEMDKAGGPAASKIAGMGAGGVCQSVATAVALPKVSSVHSIHLIVRNIETASLFIRKEE